MTEVIFTERELDVMAVLWSRGDATVAEVREALSDPLAYTTVLTILRTLEDKGFVGHVEEGRAHRYHPLVEQETARESALSRLTRKLFEDSRSLLLTHLVSGPALDDDELRRLRDLLDRELED
jgi:predicted transcriptional regulator